MTDHVCVLGGGSWGTMLAHLAGLAGTETLLYMRSEERVDELNVQSTNSRYLGDTPLCDKVRGTTELEEAVSGAALVIFCVPSYATRKIAGLAGEFLTGDQICLSATKGLEPETFQRMSEVIRQETCIKKVGAISGPNLAKEIVAGQPSATVVASRYTEAIRAGATYLHGDTFRVYGNTDVAGVELAGALKNVIAIASGCVSGLGYGVNVRAALVTRGLAEIQRLGVKLGSDPLTFSGLAGIGDLMVTCGSELSRNFRVGRGIAAGKSLDAICEELGEVAEGINTTRVANALAKQEGVAMPITEGVGLLISGQATPQEVLADLMTRAARYEIDFDYSAEV